VTPNGQTGDLMHLERNILNTEKENSDFKPGQMGLA